MNSSTPNKPVSSKTRNLTAILLILFFPVGLILMWIKRVWHPAVRTVITVFFLLVVLGGILTEPESPSSTLQVQEDHITQSTNPPQKVVAEVKEQTPPKQEIVSAAVEEESELTIQIELKQYEERAMLFRKYYYRSYDLIVNHEGSTFQEFVKESLRIRDLIEAQRNEIQTKLGTNIGNYNGSKYNKQLFVRTSTTVHFLWQGWYDVHRYISFAKGAGSGGSKEDCLNSLSSFVEDYNDMCALLEDRSKGKIVLKRLSEPQF